MTHVGDRLWHSSWSSTNFRYLLCRPAGVLHDTIPYLESKSENDFQVPQDLFVISA